MRRDDELSTAEAVIGSRAIFENADGDGAKLECLAGGNRDEVYGDGGGFHC